MKRRNLIGSLAAGIGVLFSRGRLTASPSPLGAGGDGSLAVATVRVVYADAFTVSWEAVTNGGILVTGSTSVGLGNLQIIHDAINAIVAAGGPRLEGGQIALFGGQS